MARTGRIRRLSLTRLPKQPSQVIFGAACYEAEIAPGNFVLNDFNVFPAIIYPETQQHGAIRAVLPPLHRRTGGFTRGVAPKIIQLTNNFEGGTSGTTITGGVAGNSGGASGNYLDAVSIGSGAGLVFSNAEAAHGLLSLLSTTGVSAANSFLRWSLSLTDQSVSQAWFRIYVYIPAYPGSVLELVRAQVAPTFCAGLGINTSGNVTLLNSSQNPVNTSVTVLPLNQWFRIEGFFYGSAANGQIQALIFAGAKDAVTPTEIVTSAGNINTNSPFTSINFGNPASIASYTFYMDDVGVSNTGYLGPVRGGNIPPGDYGLLDGSFIPALITTFPSF